MSLRKLTITLCWGLALLVVGIANPGAAEDGRGVSDTDCPPSVRVKSFAGPEFDDNMPGYADGPVYSARFRFPTNVLPYTGSSTDSTNLVFVADTGNHMIRFILNDKEVHSLAGQPEVAGFEDTDRDPETGQLSGGLFNSPTGMAVDESGNLYVADTGNHAIRRVLPDGQVQTIAGEEGLFHQPMGVAYGYLNRAPVVFVADTGNHCIRAVHLTNDGFSVTTLAGECGQPATPDEPRDAGSPVRFSNPRRIDWWAQSENRCDSQGCRPTFVGPGFLVVTDDNELWLLRESTDQGALLITTVPAGKGTQSVFLDNRYDLYITKPNSNRLEMIEHRGRGLYHSEARPLTQEGCGEMLNLPQGVATYFGSLVIADTDNHAIRMMGSPGLTGLVERCIRCGPNSTPN